MLQVQGSWSYPRIYSPPSTEYQLYLLFLLVAGVVGIIKLVIVWWVAPPFRLSRAKGSPAYLNKLAATAASLQRWTGATFFSWALCVSFSVVDVGQRLLEQREPWGAPIILVVIMDYSRALSSALVVALLLYLIRWHILKRIEYLHRQSVGVPPR